jgi:hypothetical protein
MANPMGDFRATILATLGHGPDTIELGRFIRFATRGRPGDSAGWCKLFDDGRAGVFGCHRQGITALWTASERMRVSRAEHRALAGQVSAATAERHARQREQWRLNAQSNAMLWEECTPLQPNDPVWAYLERRGLVRPFPPILRCHEELTYWQDGQVLGTFAAMVAPLVASDGRTVALHRTYLTSSGCKAAVPSPKKITPASGILAGACIPLWAPEKACIGVAEGIETALAAGSASGVPTVAAYSAAGLSAYVWPEGLCRLVIFADADSPGRQAADKLRVRSVRARLRCDVLTPTDEGSDWCDVWARRGAVSPETRTA